MIRRVHLATGCPGVARIGNIGYILFYILRKDTQWASGRSSESDSKPLAQGLEQADLIEVKWPRMRTHPMGLVDGATFDMSTYRNEYA